MTKVKHARTADCVVAGYRHGKDGKGVASLLLGLYDEQGQLHHVGVATGFAAAKRKELEVVLAEVRDRATEGHPWMDPAHGMSHGAVTESAKPKDPDAAENEGQRLPGGVSRWTGDKDLSWFPVRIELVAEVAYDHLQGARFRHATRFVRWRRDREPSSCSYAQLERVAPAELAALLAPADSGGPAT
jgi:ATP-dependent DNA ligase